MDTPPTQSSADNAIRHNGRGLGHNELFDQDESNLEISTSTVRRSDDEENSDGSPTRTTGRNSIRRNRSLRIDTRAPDPASETSSIVPTSARLSIASTTHPLIHRSLNQALNPDPAPSIDQDTFPPLLENILQNPGWSAAMQASQGRRQRGNSLQSMRSLVPTLPPYEEYRNHVLVPSSEAGPSLPRYQYGVGSGGTGEKGRAQSVRVTFAEAEPSAEQPPQAHEASSEGEEAALIAHYSRVVRTIDSRYTAEVARLTQEKQHAIEEFEREAARMRNEIDATYRGVLRERDKAVERAREEAASRVEELEKQVGFCKTACDDRIEKVEESARGREEHLRGDTEREVKRARHEVEDVWERRWRDRMALVDEEMERRVRERDSEWLAFLDREDPGVRCKAEDAMVVGGTKGLD